MGYAYQKLFLKCKLCKIEKLKLSGKYQLTNMIKIQSGRILPPPPSVEQTKGAILNDIASNQWKLFNRTAHSVNLYTAL